MNASVFKHMIAISSLALLCIILLFKNDGQPLLWPKAHTRSLTRDLLSNQDTMRESRTAIATLASNYPNDIKDLCFALQSLQNLRGEDKTMSIKAPVLIFNEGDLHADQMATIQKCTDRDVLFPIVTLNGQFPPGFDPDKEYEAAARFRVHANRDRWSYSQMIRFWTTNMWKHPAVQQFDTIMRIDTDSCFLEQTGKTENPKFYDLPHLRPKYVYQSNYNGDVGNPNQPEYIEGLYDFTVEYLARNNIEPANPELWDIVKRNWEKRKNLPVFQTNFEITRKSFFQREDVAKWHESLTEVEPFGVWRHRWGDAQTRFLTAAIFGTKDSILLSLHKGYRHGRGHCERLMKQAQQQQEDQQPQEVPKQTTVSNVPKGPEGPLRTGNGSGPKGVNVPKDIDGPLRTGNGSGPKGANVPKGIDGPLRTGNGSGPKGVAWFLNYGVSGASYIISLVTSATGTAVATNYGNELRNRNFNYMTTPNIAYTEDGPFKYSTDPFPKGYLLTKTHCAGYCIECPPQEYDIDPIQFANKCASGVKDKPEGGNVGIKYSLDMVKKAVHMYRNPFDNCVASFHNVHNRHLEQGHRSWKYGHGGKGFREWCQHMDTSSVNYEKREWTPEIIALAKDVPCHAIFHRYAQWHNNAIKATKEMGIPTLDIFYEDFRKNTDHQLRRLLDFLDLPLVGDIIPFQSVSYEKFFTNSEREKIITFLKHIASPELNRRMHVYFENKSDASIPQMTASG